jgi:hypothetical protein
MLLKGRRARGTPCEGRPRSREQPQAPQREAPVAAVGLRAGDGERPSQAILGRLRDALRPLGEGLAHPVKVHSRTPLAVQLSRSLGAAPRRLAHGPRQRP